MLYPHAKRMPFAYSKAEQNSLYGILSHMGMMHWMVFSSYVYTDTDAKIFRMYDGMNRKGYEMNERM
jgi:hypothetical protein